MAWGFKHRSGVLWPVAFRTRAQVMEWATKRVIGADDYDRLGNDSARWALARSRGHRIVRVTVSENG